MKFFLEDVGVGKCGANSEVVVLEMFVSETSELTTALLCVTGLSITLEFKIFVKGYLVVRLSESSPIVLARLGYARRTFRASSPYVFKSSIRISIELAAEIVDLLVSRLLNKFKS